MNLDQQLAETIEMDERALQIVPKMSATRANALALIAAGRIHEVHLREIRGLEHWDLVKTSGVHGQERPTSGWLTPLGKVVHRRIEKAQG